MSITLFSFLKSDAALNLLIIFMYLDLPESHAWIRISVPLSMDLILYYEATSNGVRALKEGSVNQLPLFLFSSSVPISYKAKESAYLYYCSLCSEPLMHYTP